MASRSPGVWMRTVVRGAASLPAAAAAATTLPTCFLRCPSTNTKPTAHATRMMANRQRNRKMIIPDIRSPNLDDGLEDRGRHIQAGGFELLIKLGPDAGGAEFAEHAALLIHTG